MSLETLRRFLERDIDVSILVAADGDDRDEGDLILQRLNVHEDVASEFREVARTSVAYDVSERAYDPGYKPEADELCVLDLNDEPEIARVIEGLSDVDSAEVFGADDEIIDNLRFYATVLTRGPRRAVFLRSYSPKKELSRRGGFALMMRAGSYNHVREKVFLFDEAIDCFAWNGVLYIRNVVQFQRIFEYFDRLRERVRGTLRRVARRVPISNFDEFCAACEGNTLMSAKVAAIGKKPYLSRVTMDDVKRTITEFNLEVEIDQEDGEERIVFDSSREGRWLILKLLDDDFLGSVMTREKYAVNSKHRV